MHSSFRFLQVVSMMSLCAIALATQAPALAADRGFYLGADVVTLQTTLDYGFIENYSTTHARLKVGYQISKYLSVEGRVMSSDYDTDIDVIGGEYRFDTGTMAGIYIRPHSNAARKANVYGIFGITSMNTKYRLVQPLTGPTDTENVIAVTIGVGGSFRIVGNLTFDIEAALYAGTADYATYFADSIDLTSVGLSAGLRYRF